MAEPKKVDLDRLDEWAFEVVHRKNNLLGYPMDEAFDLHTLYKWMCKTRVCDMHLNNLGDPRRELEGRGRDAFLSTHRFENEVIDFFAPLYGFDVKDVWGFVTCGGTDGNMHGMYFGCKSLIQDSHGMKPIVYVSNEAHYSVKRIADLQNLDLTLVPADKEGCMIVDEFEKLLDVTRPALIVVAMGTTFKGGIDDIDAIAKVLKRKKPVAQYIHLDAALFGGLLPFTKDHDMVDRRKHFFNSIAVSGHKFFGFDEPTGIFITDQTTLGKLNPFDVPYLLDAVPTISCSRSAVLPLKFWYRIQEQGMDGFKYQAERVFIHTAHLKHKLDKMGYPAWLGPHSNTVYFRRPLNEQLMIRWGLAPEYDERLGGPLAHIVVMQHAKPHILDQFVEELAEDFQKQKELEARGERRPDMVPSTTPQNKE